MEPHDRPWYPELLGWIPIALTLGVLALVLYRITFVATGSPTIQAPGASTPAPLGSDASRVTAAASGLTPAAVSAAASTPTATALAPVVAAAESARPTLAAPPPTVAPSASPVRRPTPAPRAAAVLSAVVAPSPGASATGSPGPTWTGSYVVQRGDTLSAIAARYKVSVQDLQQTNRIEQANRITVGQKIVVPATP